MSVIVGQVTTFGNSIDDTIVYVVIADGLDLSSLQLTSTVAKAGQIVAEPVL